MKVNLTLLTVLIFILMACTQIPKEKPIILKYQPMQCDPTPWQDYSVKETQNPLLDEINQIKGYYQSKGISLEVKIGPLLDNQGNLVNVVCEACSICSEMRTVYAKAELKKSLQLKKDSWVIEEKFIPEFQ
ncbi:hypothetical protein HY498_03275 [Candidatus Woesearchaeota archaeon]|nr:hypothetical protein [Candidatus Woesearchaeota archaeon]